MHPNVFVCALFFRDISGFVVANLLPFFLQNEDLFCSTESERSFLGGWKSVEIENLDASLTFPIKAGENYFEVEMENCHNFFRGTAAQKKKKKEMFILKL